MAAVAGGGNRVSAAGVGKEGNRVRERGRCGVLSKWTGAAESFYLALLTVCQRVNVPWRATSAKVVKMKLKLARAWYFCKSQIKSEIRVSDIRYNGKNVNVPIF